ncbi:hypothetical protein PIB30_047473 [Stylosanthes scabra]|uniref:Aminotransferase-like plant mobile domain-containing protein n=1 Tax=Stylosanthes scabra TaxID=79078 RepID=A0ABU6ZFI0_9FABA|nr:hypothetical protein [Stylosanthes scabra]
MFTEFGIRVPFSDFQQRLLNRASVAPSQLHWNAWSAIRCFELVTEFLELPQDPEVFPYLFTLFSPNTEGKTKKGYMSVRHGKYRKIFCLYEDSFHDLKGRFFKIFPVGEHRPFWLSLEGQGRFPPYWSQDAGMEYVPVTYKGLNADQKDTVDILVKLFFERNLKPKSVLGSPSEAREAIGIYTCIYYCKWLGMTLPWSAYVVSFGQAFLILVPGTSVPPSNGSLLAELRPFRKAGVRVMLEVVGRLFLRYLPHLRSKFLLLPNISPRNA